ncbi:hypothetical protein PP713_08635 [Mycobacterium sp. CSUR Q5927]|nr:hypothetical protein [Mycobacterium sp. CSUR Q5927]
MPDNAGELTPEDVAEFTKGRLDPDDPRVSSLLAVALTAARRYCGWHVTPVRSETVTVDGPGSPMLILPTLRLAAVTSLTEDGVAVDLGTVTWSARGLVCKRSRRPWTREFMGITATINHGFANAEDWQSAVLSLVDHMEDAFSPEQSTAQKVEVIGPFTNPLPDPGMAPQSLFTVVEKYVFDSYALEKAP